MKQNPITLEHRNTSTIFINVPNTATKWFIRNSFYGVDETYLTVNTDKDASSVIIKLPKLPMIYWGTMEYLLNECPRDNQVTICTGRDKSQLIARLEHFGYNVKNPIRKPDFRDYEYYSGKKNYAEDYHNWYQANSKLDKILIYIGYLDFNNHTKYAELDGRVKTQKELLLNNRRISRDTQ